MDVTGKMMFFEDSQAYLSVCIADVFYSLDKMLEN